MRTTRRLLSALQRLSIAVLAIVAPIACTPSADEQGSAAIITLTSSSLADGTIPKKYNCEGDGISPALSWSAPPTGTKSYALIVTDPDSPVGFIRHHAFAHWVLYALDSKPELPATASERDLRKAMHGHVIGRGQLVASFHRQGLKQ